MKKAFKVLEDLTQSSIDIPKELEPSEPDLLEDAFLDVIKNNQRTIVKNVRDYVKAQKDDWQKLPYLALKSDGRTGYMHYKKCIYQWGFFPISTISDTYDMYIDCASGDLAKDVEANNLIKQATDEDCIYLSLRLDSIKASRYISKFEKEAKLPLASFITQKEHDEYQNSNMERLNLKEIYTRK